MIAPGPEAEWRAALAEGRFTLQRAVDSGTWFFPPRHVEPRSGDADWEWLEASGMGTVYSATVIHSKPPAAPYAVVLVDLDEGPRLMSRVDGLPASDVAIGQRVRARIVHEDDAPLLVFEPAR